MAKSCILLFAFVALAVSSLFITAILCQEVEDENEFAYEGPRGPEHWGELREDWKNCSKGQRQSPIDIITRDVKVIPAPRIRRQSYVPSNAVLENRGHDIMVNWSQGAGLIDIDGIEYNLHQCHWHSPAEHTINGIRYPLEIHLVHQAENKSNAVVAIIYEFGTPDAFLLELTYAINLIADMEAREEPLGLVDPNHIMTESMRYYGYVGSLTTPPCTEGVVWTIVKEIRTVSREQVAALRRAVHDNYVENARPIQPTNGRDIYIYTSGDFRGPP